MTQWTEVVLAHLYPWPIGVLISASAVSLLFGAIGVVALWRVRRLLKVVPTMQERLDSLSNSVALLTDTTESCFKALSMQLQFMQTQSARDVVIASRPRASQPAAAPVEEAGARKARQRRVVGAARRGDAVSAIAAREDLSESEVALRLHINREQNAESKRGTLLS